MTRVEIVVVGIRLLAAWFLAQGVIILSYTALTPMLAGDYRSATTVLIEFTLFCVVSVLTWRSSTTLAARVLPVPDPGDAVMPLAKRDLEAVLLRILGLFLGLTAVSSLAYSYMNGDFRRNAGIDTAGWQGGPEIARASVQFLAGVCLVLGKSGFAKIVDVVRHGGDPVDEEEAEGNAEDRKGSAEN